MRKALAVLALLLVVGVLALVLFVRGAIGGDAVRRELESRLSERVGEPVAIGALTASYFPRVALELREVTVGRPPRATIAELSIATGLRGLLSRRVEEADVIVSNSRIPVGMALGIAGASASSGSSASSDGGWSIVSIRTLAFRNVELLAEPRSLIVNLESSLEGDQLKVSKLTASSADTTLEATGRLTSIVRREGTFTATAGQLNLDEILALGAGLAASAPASSGNGSGSAPGPLNITMALTSPGGVFGGYRFGDLKTTARITAGEQRLDPLHLTMFGGTFDGALHAATGTATPQTTLNGRISGMDVATVLKETRGSTSLSGTISGRLSIAAAGSSSSDILRTARGSGQMTISDGLVPGLEMVRTIILAFGKPSGAPPAGSGSAFTRLGGTFTLADQTLRSTDLVFASRDFDMSGAAVVRLPAGSIDMRASVALSRELTAQAGTDLRRYAQEDGRVVVPAVITGTVASPSVNIDVAAALNRALKNELNRRMKGLLDRFIKR